MKRFSSQKTSLLDRKVYIWTTILVQPCCYLFSLVKNIRERGKKRKRENKKIMWIWKIKLY